MVNKYELLLLNLKTLVHIQNQLNPPPPHPHPKKKKNVGMKNTQIYLGLQNNQTLKVWVRLKSGVFPDAKTSKNCFERIPLVRVRPTVGFLR